MGTHRGLADITKIVPETNSEITGSYAMVDPAGRFFDNAQGVHHYSEPILKVGADIAFRQVDYDFGKFISRGGKYDWALAKV